MFYEVIKVLSRYSDLFILSLSALPESPSSLPDLDYGSSAEHVTLSSTSNSVQRAAALPWQ